MLPATLALICGLILLVISARYFVDGSAACARHLGMPPLLIGMVVVGFGTSAPEMAVSILAALQGDPGIALGNAYGSNICNIGLILGLTALIRPIAVQQGALKHELPILLAITGLAAWQARDGSLSRIDGLTLLIVFAILMFVSIRQGLRSRQMPAAPEPGPSGAQAEPIGDLSLPRALLYVLAGLLVLVASSRLLVWGAVTIAGHFGVSDLIIGLSIVAVGTSLPELASSLVAASKGEDELALGNILGSNLFNTLAVVGLAAGISPMQTEPAILLRDIPVMAVLTAALFLLGWAPKDRAGRINRLEGALLLAVYVAYTLTLLKSAGAF